MNQAVSEASLYERDFNLWIEDTVARLKAGNFDHLDLEHVIEEIESLGRRDRRELKQRLRVLFSHLLKRMYVASPDDFSGWKVTIRNQRTELQDLLEESPSLKHFLLSEFDSIWQAALSELQEDYASIDFPNACPFPKDVEVLLSQRFWEK